MRRKPYDLDTTKITAIVALSRGASVTDAASEAGTERATVLGWLADDPRFVAGLNLAKRHAVEALRAEVRVGAAEAVAALRQLVKDGPGPMVRLKAATALLKAGGGESPESIGSTDPEEIENEAR